MEYIIHDWLSIALLFLLAALIGVLIGLAKQRSKKELLPFKNYNEQPNSSEPTNSTASEKSSDTSEDAIWN